MKLQILVPQYKETDEIVKPLLDSLLVQQNIDFNEIGVIICNDGTDVKLSDELLSSYPFKVDYYQCEHHGVSATRNACLDKAISDYVMFADCDDMFYNACGLWIIFREIENGGFDSLVSAFIEETRNPLTKEVMYVNHDVDSTFVHGKIHRRKYLIDNNIRWNDSLTIHEDSYFNCLCQKLSSNIKYCPTPFYLWKWRDDSVCRHDPLYLNKTFINMLNSNTALVNEFIKRDKRDEAIFYATNMLFDSYYSMNCDRWWDEQGSKYKEVTEKRIKQYYNDFEELFNACPQEIKTQVIVGIKNRFFTEGLFLERITFDDWIKHIKEL